MKPSHLATATLLATLAYPTHADDLREAVAENAETIELHQAALHLAANRFEEHSNLMAMMRIGQSLHECTSHNIQSACQTAQQEADSRCQNTEKQEFCDMANYVREKQSD